MQVNIINREVPHITRNKRIYTEILVAGTSTSESGTGGGDKNFIHTQGVPSATWVIQHNLGKYPSVTVIDTAGTEVEGEVRHVDVNNLVLEFSAGFAGTATLN